MYVKKSCQNDVHKRNICTFNVDEIDTNSMNKPSKKFQMLRYLKQLAKGGKTAKLYESKSYFVNFNIMTGTSWPREHRKR